MVEAAPAAALVVPKPEFLLELLVIAFDAPPELGEFDQARETNVLRQGREPVLGGFLLAFRPLDQEPFLRTRFAQPVVAMSGSHRLWCVNQAVDVRRPLGAFSGDALRHRHAEPRHPVEHRAADPGFGLLGRQCSGAKATTDACLVAGYGGLPKRAPAVADRLLPAQAPLVPDHLDVLVALTGRGPGSRAQRCGGPWRDDHRHGWVGLTLSHGAVDGLAVVGPVGCHRRKGTGDLLEQGADLGGVALVVARQLGREDLARAGINRQMKLAPGPLAPLAVLLDQPLARAVDLQAGRVDHDVNRPARLGPR